MHRKLLLKAFEKAHRTLKENGMAAPSKTRCAEELSAVISETFPYSERRLRDFYNKAISKNHEEVNIPQAEVVLALIKYLGHRDFREFKEESERGQQFDLQIRGGETLGNKKNLGKKSTQRERSQPKTNRKFVARIAIAGIALVVLALWGYLHFNKQRWMEWKGTQYVEVPFDSQKVNAGVLKLYSEDRITHLKKINVTADTQFFNEDGSVRVWYGKNKEGTLEYFTSYGLHPETGKTLKPITNYMIQKYIYK